MKDRQQIIVSLTSFPAAIPYAVQAIRSVLSGTMLPDKIVLYLDTQKFPDGKLPAGLEALKAESPLLDVRFDPAEIRSYKKLLPALRDFPEDVIVTIDDDICYRPDMLYRLVRLHKRLPDAIIAHRVRRIKPDMPYSEWRKYKWYDFVFKRIHYPERFMALAPTTDDVWFWAAAVSKGTYVVPVPNGHSRAKEVGKPKEYSLKTINLKPGDDRNRDALDKILEHYPHIRQRIEDEK